MTEDEIVGWHHRFNGHEFQQTPGDGEGQGPRVARESWGVRSSHCRAEETSPSRVFGT